MKRIISFLGFWLLIMFSAVCWAAEPTPPKPFVDCNDCHGLSPGLSGRQKNFNPGAHPLHAKIQCDQCHAEGGAPAHVDGIITMKPELDYSNGTEVPWPSAGGGSCGGGNIFTGQAAGCHADPAARCDWVPDGNCRQ